MSTVEKILLAVLLVLLGFALLLLDYTSKLGADNPAMKMSGG